MMVHPPKNSRVTRHISFSEDENILLCRRAAEASMSVAPFIKQQALHGSIKDFPLTPISQHTLAISKAVTTIREITAHDHHDRLLYEADLERITAQLGILIATEEELLQILKDTLE